jgi:hypothetical protein
MLIIAVIDDDGDDDDDNDSNNNTVTRTKLCCPRLVYVTAILGYFRGGLGG